MALTEKTPRTKKASGFKHVYTNRHHLNYHHSTITMRFVTKKLNTARIAATNPFYSAGQMTTY